MLGTEECLYLNIQVKSETIQNRDVNLKPVVVFFHGGGWKKGDGMGNKAKAAEHQDAVFIQVKVSLIVMLHDSCSMTHVT